MTDEKVLELYANAWNDEDDDDDVAECDRKSPHMNMKMVRKVSVREKRTSLLQGKACVCA